MTWRRKFSLNVKQKEETAKVLLGICQIVIIAVIAGRFIPDFAKTLGPLDILYGFGLIIILYITSMKLLEEVN